MPPVSGGLLARRGAGHPCSALGTSGSQQSPRGHQHHVGLGEASQGAYGMGASSCPGQGCRRIWWGRCLQHLSRGGKKAGSKEVHNAGAERSFSAMTSANWGAQKLGDTPRASRPGGVHTFSTAPSRKGVAGHCKAAREGCHLAGTASAGALATPSTQR